MPARPSIKRENSRIATGAKIIVVFCCANCNAGYKATQYRQVLQDVGTFRCQVCGVEVYSWSGDYDYIDWTAIKAKLKRRKKR